MGPRAHDWLWVVAFGALLIGGCSGAHKSSDASSEDGRLEGGDADASSEDGRLEGGDADAASPEDSRVEGGDATDPDAGLADAHGEDASSPVDASPPDDARAGDAATSCAGLFCEDFETGHLDPNIWSLETGGGQTVTIEDGVVAHGKHSVHFHIPPNVGTYGFIITKGAPAALHSHYFGRASFYVTPQLPAGNAQLVLAGNGTFPDFDHFFVSVGALGWMRKVVLTNTVVGEEETWAMPPSLQLAGRAWSGR